jgi:hypothetical protein
MLSLFLGRKATTCRNCGYSWQKWMSWTNAERQGKIGATSLCLINKWMTIF